MRALIEFCVSNMHHGTDRVMKQLEENPEYDVLEYGCLGNCGGCFMAPYALVNGDLVSAETADELLQLIIEKIETEQSQFDFLDDLL